MTKTTTIAWGGHRGGKATLINHERETHLWWTVNCIELCHDFMTILQAAANSFPDSEIENYPYLAEALWAEEQGL